MFVAVGIGVSVGVGADVFVADGVAVASDELFDHTVKSLATASPLLCLPSHTMLVVPSGIGTRKLVKWSDQNVISGCTCTPLMVVHELLFAENLR